MLARYMLKRIVHAVVVLLAVLVVVWILVNQIGDPARLILPPSASHQLYLDTRASLGLDDPLWEQFWRSFSGWLQADFGTSIWQKVPALPLVLERVPATLFLTVATFIIALAIPAERVLYQHRGRVIEAGNLVDVAAGNLRGLPGRNAGNSGTTRRGATETSAL